MKNEADFKKHFKASVRAQGGFSISLSAPVFPGIPDLYCVMPGFAPVLLEAKWLKEITDKTNKQIPLTEVQKHFINNCNKVHTGIAWCLVGYKFDNYIWAVLLNTSDRVQIGGARVVCIRKQTEHFDIVKLFELYVPKLNYEYKPLLTKDWQPDSVEVSHAIGETVADTSTLALPK